MRNCSRVSQLCWLRTFFLQEREEGFHCGVVAAGSDSAHGPDELVVAQAVDVSPRAKLRPSVAVHDAPGHVDAVSGATYDG